jgi:CrcB protein
MFKNFLLVGFGGALGSMLRYGLGILLGVRSFPITTLFINIIGSFVIGIIIGLSLESESFNLNWKPLLATGLCGGFTTFSAFSIENIQLIQQGKFLLSGAYILLSIILGITAAWLGYELILRN